MTHMAKPRDPYFDFVEELLAALGPIRIKRMFGGAGVYAADVMFALVADDELYLKADEALAAQLEAEGSEPFTFEMKDGRTAQMKYWRLPSAATDDPEVASDWARRALDVALKAKAAKPVRKRRK